MPVFGDTHMSLMPAFDDTLIFCTSLGAELKKQGVKLGLKLKVHGDLYILVFYKTHSIGFMRNQRWKRNII